MHLRQILIDQERQLIEDLLKLDLSEPQSGNYEGSQGIKQKRLIWALEHQDWSTNDWRNVFNLDNFEPIEDGTPWKEPRPDTMSGPEGCGKDLSLLENILDVIEPKLRELGLDPKSVQELHCVLYNLWHSDPQMVQQIEYIYESMPWRVASVIQRGGEPLDM